MLKQEGRVTYFVGPDSYFWHPETDAAGPRFARATLIAPGPVRAREGAVSGLGIAHRTLRHWTRPLDEQGPGSFHAPRPGRGGAVRTPGKAAACGRRLAAGETIVGGARLTGVGEWTLRQAVRDGRVVRTATTGVSAAPGGAEGTTPSERGRSEARAAEGMGRAGPRAGERTAAALGLMKSAVTRLERCREVDLGGLLAGLPVWCGNGRLSGLGRPLSLPNGQYSARPLPIILGFRALARIGRPEGRRQVPPGELGQAVGLDRVPEGRRLRAQIAARADRGTPEKWMRELSRTGREADPQEAGYLYGDGPVRVQHGSGPLLPRRQVSRERRCWSGPTDYGINDALGRPFFVVSQAVADGRAATRLEELLPERWAGVPAQPSEAERAADPLRPPFVVLFDRAGSSHRGRSKLWERRSGAIPQRKAVKDLWPESEFSDSEGPVPGGGATRMKRASRSTGWSAGDAWIPGREIRRLTPTGHPTALLTPARRGHSPLVAGRMFSRWCQENSFGCRRQPDDLDGLVPQGGEEIPGTVEVLNPAWRTLEKALKDPSRRIRKLHAQLGAATRQNDGGAMQARTERLQDIQRLAADPADWRSQRRNTPRK